MAATATRLRPLRAFLSFGVDGGTGGWPTVPGPVGGHVGG